MSKHRQIDDHIEQARDAVDAALTLADIVARHGIVHSQSFNQLVIFLNDAAEAITRFGEGDAVERETAFQPIAHGSGRALSIVANDS